MFAAAHGFSGLANGGADAGIGAASADVGDRGVDIRVAWGFVGAKQGGGGHNHARLAKAALRHLMRDPALLQRVAAVFRQTLDGGDEAAFAFGDGDEATADGLAVNIHRASAAIAGAATIFGAGEVGGIAQRPKQRCFGVHPIFDGPFIDRESGHAAALDAAMAFSHASLCQSYQCALPSHQIPRGLRRRGFALDAGRADAPQPLQAGQ